MISARMREAPSVAKRREVSSPIPLWEDERGELARGVGESGKRRRLRSGTSNDGNLCMSPQRGNVSKMVRCSVAEQHERMGSRDDDESRQHVPCERV